MREVSPKDFYDREEIGFLFLYVFTMDEVFNDTYIRKNFIAFHHEKRHSSFSRWKCLNSYGLRNRTCFSQKMT